MLQHLLIPTSRFLVQSFSQLSFIAFRSMIVISSLCSGSFPRFFLPCFFLIVFCSFFACRLCVHAWLSACCIRAASCAIWKSLLSLSCCMASRSFSLCSPNCCIGREWRKRSSKAKCMDSHHYQQQLLLLLLLPLLPS